MKLGRARSRFLVLVSSVLALACSKIGGEKDAASGPKLGVGAPCQSSPECRAPLVCSGASKTCTPSASAIQGGTCDLSADCTQGNYCTQQGICAASGKGIAGSVCSFEGDCTSGLLCAEAGLTGVCSAGGHGDLGQGCADVSECMAGLMCIAGICDKATARPWTGALCPAEEQTPRVLFHVPRASDPTTTTDFYRLPFPNDIRLKGGRVSLTGHPKPGPRILPFDVVDRYLGAIEAESTGFGANQVIYFRFSKQFSTTNFPFDCSADLIDVTPGSPTYGLTPGFTCSGQSGRSAYVCGPFLSVRPPEGAPLRPGNTYVAVIRKGLVDLAGGAFGPDSDFPAMLDAAVPADPELAAAHVAYKPLRDYLVAAKASGTQRFSAADLLAAAVFTVEKYEDPLAAIDHAVAALPAPNIASLVRCGDPGVVSPCDDGLTGDAHVRGCMPGDASNPVFDTYQGQLNLPVFQAGTAPYLTPSDGGNIVFQAVAGAAPGIDAGTVDGAVDGGSEHDGGISADSTITMTAVVQRTEKVCFVLAVPKGTPPASGWPVVVYGHGTGGSYRSVLDSGLAQDFAGGAAPAGLQSTAGAAPVPMATLGFDGVLHGTRANGSTKAPSELVYNFLNPRAARDNPLQAAADLLVIPRALAGFAVQGIPIDSRRLALYGHSQGGNAASLVAARESRYQTIVMSGTGGMLIHSLLGKTQPVNLPAVLPYVLGESGPMDAGNAVLNLMQMYFERSDPVNFGRRLFADPLPEMTPRHILHVLGTKDSYAVVETQKAYAMSVGFQVAGPVLVDFGIKPATPPVWNNEYFGPFQLQRLTAVELQYAPGAYDGHFVSTENPAARAAIQQMLVTTFRDGVPTVSP